MGWLSDIWKAISGSGDKESLIRRLLERRIAQDPNAARFGQTPAFAHRIDALQLMGMPEATIVTCVETWATLSRQGVLEDEIARRIAEHRAAHYTGGGVQPLIHRLMQTEHSDAWYLPAAHIDWCIREARTAYGV
jgi:hypothetical protein